MTNMSIQPLWLTYFIEILSALEFQLKKTYFGTFSYKAHFRPQISSNEGFLFREFPSTVFRKGVHWSAPFEEIYLFIQSYLKDSKFWKLGFLRQTLDQQTSGQGRTPQIVSEGDEAKEDIMLMLQRMMNLPEREPDMKVKILQARMNMFWYQLSQVTLFMEVMIGL